MVRERTDLERERRVLRLLELALEVPESERETWITGQCGEDADLADAVRRLVQRESREGCLGPLGSPSVARLLAARAAPELRPGTRIGGFELLRRIGEGGMGRVYEAHQEHPDRRVALKVLRTDLGSASLRERFRQEADLLARLDHPDIARVIAAGVHVEETDLGERRTPWFALEFVEGGRDLFTYAREESLSIERRVELFARICRAVHHGHLRGVLHRDLKASNLLVRPDGRPVVIDFGVARSLEPEGEEASRRTLAGDLVGTVATMSPEQIEGDPRDLDLRSDVYALGAVLYEFLAGKPAHDLSGCSLTEAARRVVERTPAPVPDVPRDLQAIVSTALARDRDERFDSAADMADDLDRFRRGEPVRAAAPGRLRRATLFARRHRVPLTLALGVGLALAAGVTTNYRQWRRAVAAERAEREQRLIAERRFDDLRSLARTLIFELDAELAAVPGNTRVRERIVETGLAYLERLSAEKELDPDLAAELAEAWIAIGDVQGSYTASSLGRRADARASYGRAVELARTLCAREPSPRSLQVLSRALTRIGDLELNGGRVEEARRCYDEALELALEVGRPSEELSELLVGLDGRRSDEAFTRGAWDTALELADAKCRRMESLRARHPDDVALGRETATSLAKRGRILLRTGEQERAEADFRAAGELLAAVREADPRGKDTLTALSFVTYQYGQFLAMQGREEEAARQLEDSLAHQSQLCRADPDDASARRNLLLAQTLLAQVYGHADEHRRAEPLLRECVRLARELHAAQPADPDAQDGLRSALFTAASGLAQSGRFEESADLFAELVPMAEASVRRAPGNAALLRNLYAIRRNEGSLQADWAASLGADGTDRWAAACDAYWQAIEVLERMRSAGTLPPNEEGALAELEQLIADCERRMQ